MVGDEFGKHSSNELVPFLRTLVPKVHRWRLNRVTTMQGVKDALLVLTSSDDVYVVELLGEINSHPRCTSYSEDKQFLLLLSEKIDAIVEIRPNYHLSPGQCCAFLSKLHSENMIIGATN